VDVSQLVFEATEGDASRVVDAPELDKGLEQLEKIVTDKGAWTDGFNVVFVGHGSEDLQLVESTAPLCSILGCGCSGSSPPFLAD
jgi:hypothetical protein